MVTIILLTFNYSTINYLLDFWWYNADFFYDFYKIHKQQVENYNLKIEIIGRLRSPFHLKIDRESYVMSLLILCQNSIRYAGLDDVYFKYLADSTVSYLDILYLDPSPVQSLIYIFFMNYHAHFHDLLLLKSDYEQYYIYSDRPFINWAIPIEFHTSGIKWHCDYCQFNHQNQFRETFSNEQHGGMNQGRQYKHIFHDTRTLRVFFYQIIRDKSETFYYV